MPRPPNYSHERQERDRAKARKKAEKLAAKAASKERAAEVAEVEKADTAPSDE
jgi:hypothetical protein